MTVLRWRMIEDGRVRGLSRCIQDSSVRVVRQLWGCPGKSAEEIGQENLRQFYLCLKADQRVKLLCHR